MNLEQISEGALKRLTSAGFDSAQVSASVREKNELNIAHSDASLFRSTEDHSISLKGIVDGRVASAALNDLSEDAIEHEVKGLFERAQYAPQDEANAVSEGQTVEIVKGPQEGDLSLMVEKVQELLAFREAEAPSMNIDEGFAVFSQGQDLILTSGGSLLSSKVGCYGMMAMGTAVDGDKSSSFNYAGGSTDDLSTAAAADLFGIGDMLKETERQIETQSFDNKFVGDVVLAPTAVTDLLYWFLGQLSDSALIADSSVFKDQVGEVVASPLLTLKSRFSGPGLAPITGDGFVADEFTVVDEGKLMTLMPGLYGSLKTGIEHRPWSGGWEVGAGTAAKEDLLQGMDNGALVTRLSMGHPGPSGDFSGVVKNSFMVKGGEIGPALSETMIAGNMAQMLKDIVAISADRLDNGGENLPWIRIANINYS